jgi:hypothetical protein
MFVKLKDDWTLSDVIYGVDETLKMWKEATRSCPGQFDKISSGMMETVKLYNDYTDSIGVWVEENYIEEQYDENDESKPISGRNRDKFLSAMVGGDRIIEEFMKLVKDNPDMREEDKINTILKYFHEIERFLLRRNKFQRLYSPSIEEWGVRSHSLPFPETLFRETLNWCKALTDPTRYAEAIELAMDVLRWTINYHQQDFIPQSKAIELYTEIIEVVKTVACTSVEQNLLIKKVMSDIFLSEKGNNSVVVSDLKKIFPENLDVSDLVLHGKKSISKKSKRRKLRKKTMESSS